MEVMSGKVVDIPIIQDDNCIYEIEMNNKRYKVVSKDYQAVKDRIFVNKGQIITITGEIIGDTIYSKTSTIRIRK